MRTLAARQRKSRKKTMINSKYINDILYLLLDGDEEIISLRKQLECLSEKSFEYTGSGVFVSFAHSEKAKEFRSEKSDLVLNGLAFVTSEFPVEGDATLFFKEGIINYLEIWCHNGENYPEKDLVKYTLTQNWVNSPGKVITTETPSR
jgi:hypothetical protein